MPNQQEVLAPPRLTTHDPEELNEWSRMVGWQTDYRQLGSGSFESWFDIAVGDDIRVVERYCNREMIASGVPPAGYVPILITHNRGSKGIFQGKEMQADEVAIMRPGFEGTYRTPPEIRGTTILIPEARLRGALETMENLEFDKVLPGTRLVSLPSEAIGRMTWLSGQLTKAMREPSENCGTTSAWISEIDQHFISALTSGLSDSNRSAPQAGARERHVRIVSQARDYIEAHLNSPLGLEELTRATGVSARTLEYAFRTVYDTTPLRFIKARRLHAARRLLLKSRNGPRAVTNAALAVGMTHLGYFARDYRALFGLSPSETLKSSRKSA